jgi:hypothetical protein
VSSTLEVALEHHNLKCNLKILKFNLTILKGYIWKGHLSLSNKTLIQITINYVKVGIIIINKGTLNWRISMHPSQDGILKS